MQVSRLKNYKKSSFKQDFVISKRSIRKFSTSSSLLEIIVDLMANSWAAAALVQQEAACCKTPCVGHCHMYLWLLEGIQEEGTSLHQAPR